MSRFDFAFSESKEDYTVEFSETSEIIRVDLGEIKKIEVMPEIYTGDTEVIPSAKTVVLDTKGKGMIENIVVKPIPSNYGLITYDGATLTVS